MQELLKQADEMVKNPPERIHYAIKMILDLADKLRTTNDLDTQKEGHLFRFAMHKLLCINKFVYNNI